MYCPKCKSIAPCKAVPGAVVTSNTRDYNQRFHFSAHSDINFFQRGRECLGCGFRFLSGEVNLKFLTELIELRDALKTIKANAEAYKTQSLSASKSLSALSESLDILSALKMYKDADG